MYTTGEHISASIIMRLLANWTKSQLEHVVSLFELEIELPEHVGDLTVRYLEIRPLHALTTLIVIERLSVWLATVVVSFVFGP